MVLACDFTPCPSDYTQSISGSCASITSQGLCLHSYKLYIPSGLATPCVWAGGVCGYPISWVCVPPCWGSSFATNNVCNQESATTCESKWGLTGPDYSGCYFGNCFLNVTTQQCGVTSGSYVCEPVTGAGTCSGTRSIGGCNGITSQSVCISRYVKNNAGRKAQCEWDSTYSVCYEGLPCV